MFPQKGKPFTTLVPIFIFQQIMITKPIFGREFSPYMTCFAEFAYVSRILVCLKLNCAENLLGNNLRFAREYFILPAFQGALLLVARNTHATQKNGLNRGFCRETVVVRLNTTFSAPGKAASYWKCQNDTQPFVL